MQTHLDNEITFSRRKFLSYSGLALGGLTISSVVPKVIAAEKPSESVAQLTSNIDTLATPTADFPVRLNFNENALGMSPHAKLAAIEAVPKANRYAKGEMPLLNKMLADLHQVDAAHILLTAGSSEGIRCSLAAFSQPNTQFVIPELTYGDGEHFANINHFKVTKVSCLKDWAFDIPAMRKAVEDHNGPSLVYLVNPNNPSSTITPAALINDWILSKPKDTLFIVDEAYAEYVDDPAFKSVDQLIRQGQQNVILLKTFSKLHAMAGMRVGYIVAAPAHIKLISDYVAGEKLNYCGVTAALASLDDKAYQVYSIKANKVSRDIMVQTLTDLGLHYLPSQTNFMFHEIPIDLARYQQLLSQHHILAGRAFPPANNWSRISLGTPGEMLYVSQVLKQLRAQKLI